MDVFTVGKEGLEILISKKRKLAKLHSQTNVKGMYQTDLQ